MGMVKGVVIRTSKDNSFDDRRSIVVSHNSNPAEGDIPAAGQVKTLDVHQKGGAWLGGKEGHYHDYAETYTVIRETVTFYLHDVLDDARQVAVVEKGQRITIPAGVAHKVYAPEGAVFVGVTEQPYSSPEQDIPFQVLTSDEDS